MGSNSTQQILLLAACVAAVVFPSFSAAQQAGSERDLEQFFIVAQGDTLLTGRHIESFNRTTGTLVLTLEGYYAWTSNIRPLVVEGVPSQEKTVLSEREFSLIYKGRSVVEGTIRSGRKSDLIAGVVLWDSDMQNNRARLSLRYLKLLGGMGPDPLEGFAFLEYFMDSGKLINWEIGWMVDR